MGADGFARTSSCRDWYPGLAGEIGMKQGDMNLEASAMNAKKPDAETFDEREARTKEFLLGNTERLLAVRTKDREFHGLEREFLYAQAQMLLDYKKSKEMLETREKTSWVGSLNPAGISQRSIRFRIRASELHLPKALSVGKSISSFSIARQASS
jgi:hypothetical protein